MMNSIYHNGEFDIKPDWFTWHINGVEHASPKQVFDMGNKIDSYLITPLETIPYRSVGSFREEMYHTAVKTTKVADGRPIVVAISGIDSEVAARLLVEAGANVELAYIKFWFKDDSEYEIIKKISRELSVPCRSHDFKWMQARESVYSSLYSTCIPASAMNCMKWLFDQYPSDRFFVTGNGAFRKIGGRFKKIAQRYDIPARVKIQGRLIPVDLRDICMRVMAQDFKLSGQYYFHISNVREVAALFKNPKMKYYPDTAEIDDKDVYFEQFGDCLFKDKTQPYGVGDNLNTEVRLCDLYENRLSSKYPTCYVNLINRITADFLPVDEMFS
jgi:7-cyano-7-deazaguanine synthase in queuosine biosynthesis